MATIKLLPGETLKIGFLDDLGFDTDGEFTVEYTGTEIKITESAGLPGTLKGGANEVLYHEKGDFTPADDDVPQSPV